MEAYPSLAEGNGLENRQVVSKRRVGSNPTASFVSIYLIHLKTMNNSMSSQKLYPLRY